MMKKFLSTVVIAGLIICLTGCGNQAGGNAESNEAATTTVVEEATTEQLSFEEVYSNIEAYVNESLKNTSNKKIDQDKDGNIMLYVAYSDGTEIAKAAKEGDEDSTESWQTLIDTLTVIGSNSYEHMKEHGYGDKYFGASLSNYKGNGVEKDKAFRF